MSGLRALLVLFGALVVQAGLGRLFPGVHQYVDVLLVPVAVYGVGSSQRTAMAMGCASGLLRDTWFHAGPFGLNGFKRTLLGWTVGAVAARFDLNQPAGRLVTGCLVSLGDDALDMIVRGLMDEHPRFPGLLALVIKAVATGLLAALVGGMLERDRRAREARRVV